MGWAASVTTALAAASLVLAVAAPSPVGAAPIQTSPEPVSPVNEICGNAGLSDIPELGAGACVALESAAVLFAAVCGQALPAEVCANIDGSVVDSSVVDGYQDSWLHQALQLQSQYDNREPMRNWLVPHTHNSSNSTANAISVANLDPNQRYSILDQLRMDIRGIELDLHLVGGQPVLCHGRTEDLGGESVHLGCSVDRTLAEGLAEITAFLDSPGNEAAFIVLYLENQLDADPAAHDAVAAQLDAAFGDLVERPPAGTGDGVCAEAPMETTRQEMLDRGSRVIIVGNCGPGGWGSWVFERGPIWQEYGYNGDDISPPDCADGVRVDRAYDANWIRHWEDLTFLSAAVAGGEQNPITPEVARGMVECGVDMIGFDRLEPFDGRLDALVWSWARDVLPTDVAGECASRHADDGRWFMDDCTQLRPYSCLTPAGVWLRDVPAGVWADGDDVCGALGAAWVLPSTGWDDNVLGAAAGGDVWLPIGRVAALDAGAAVPIGAAVNPIGVAASQPGGSPASLPNTGRDGNLRWLGLVLAVGLVARVARRSA